METLDKTVAQRLSVQYIFALLVVALLTIFGQYLVHDSLNTSQDDSHIINIAGRQRMLSQRLTKISLVLTKDEVDDKLKAIYLNKSSEAFNTWTTTHTALRDNKLFESKKYLVKNSPEILAIYKEIEPFFRVLEGEFRKLQSHPNEINMQLVLENEDLYLSTMEKIVNLYDHEATKRVNTVKSLEKLLGFLTLGTLFVEALMIFSPLVNYVKQVISRLSTSEKQTSEINDQLRFSNRMLLQAQEKLETATKEKYESKRKEDNIRSGSLLEGQEEERKRLSREMHDGVGQMLTGIKLTAAKFKSFEIDDPKYVKSLENLNALINETIEATRIVSFNLMPPVLEDYGLEAVINLMEQQFKKSGGLNINHELKLKETRLSKTLEINIYRILQESINNTLKHAKAKNFTIKLIEKEEIVFLELSDDGVGFEVEHLSRSDQNMIHNGVSNMKTRCRLLGGSFKLISSPQDGTNIFIKLPNAIEQNDDEDKNIIS